MARMRLAATKQQIKGGAATKGFSTIDLVVWIAVVLVLSAVGAGLYFVLMGNARENQAQAIATDAHGAIQSYFADYGTLPDEEAVDAYLDRNGDIPIAEAIPEGATITVYRDGSFSAPNATVTVVTSTAFDDVIVITRSGTVTKTPSDEFDGSTYSGYTVVAEWSNVPAAPGGGGDDD